LRSIDQYHIVELLDIKEVGMPGFWPELLWVLVGFGTLIFAGVSYMAGERKRALEDEVFERIHWYKEAGVTEKELLVKLSGRLSARQLRSSLRALQQYGHIRLINGRFVTKSFASKMTPP
jgi:hypothetical protein